MAGILPYATITNQYSTLVVQIAREVLPASLDSKECRLSEQLRFVLRLCWTMPPENRPSAATCLNLLTGYFTKITGGTPLVRKLVEDVQVANETPGPQILVQQREAPRSQNQDDTLPLHPIGLNSPLADGGIPLPQPLPPLSTSSPPVLTPAQQLYAGMGHLPRLSTFITTPISSGSTVTPGTALAPTPQLRKAASSQSLLQTSDPFPRTGRSRVEWPNEGSPPIPSTSGSYITSFTTGEVRRRHKDVEHEAEERERALEAAERQEEAQSRAYDASYTQGHMNDERELIPRTSRSMPVRQRSVSFDSRPALLSTASQPSPRPPMPTTDHPVVSLWRQHRNSSPNVESQDLPDARYWAPEYPLPPPISNHHPPDLTASPPTSAIPSHPSTRPSSVSFPVPRTFSPQPLSPQNLQRTRPPSTRPQSARYPNPYPHAPSYPPVTLTDVGVVPRQSLDATSYFSDAVNTE